MKFVSILLFGFALACSNNSSDSGSVAEAKTEAYDEMEFSEDVPIAEQSMNALPPPLEVQEQKIIKDAQLSFEAEDLSAMHQKILYLTKEYKGFVANDNSGKNYNRIFRNITIRIPTNNFQKMIDGISEGVAYFDQKNISRRDVTEEFVDLEARLKAKKELEKRYLELLSKANNVKEMLEIERELSNIREEIEAKQGRLKYLEDKVSLSTINIEFYKYTAESGVTVSYGQKMKNALKGGWNGISVFFLGILYLWPLFIVAIIAILIIRWLIKRNKKTASAIKAQKGDLRNKNDL